MDPMQNQLCRVCDEPAAGFHFGAFTCEGCKSFFGRTCNNQSVIGECKNNYRCVVDKKNRTSCKACRLRKCLMVGMSKSGSRYGRRSNWFKIHCLMQQNSPGGSSTSDPPAQPPPHAPCWLARKDDSSSEARDSSFGSSSRSPSPLDTSLETGGGPQKSPVSPDLRDSVSPPRQSPLSSLYSPLSLMAANPAFPFYKLSPLFASPQSSLLAPSCHPLLLSLAAAGVPRPHLDLLAEHSQLLAKFGAARSALAGAGSAGGQEGRQSQGESPIDLSIKLTTTSSSSSSLPIPSSPDSSAPDDEGIEVDIVEKSDANSNNILSSANALDLTVSS